MCSLYLFLWLKAYKLWYCYYLLGASNGLVSIVNHLIFQGLVLWVVGFVLLCRFFKYEDHSCGWRSAIALCFSSLFKIVLAVFLHSANLIVFWWLSIDMLVSQLLWTGDMSSLCLVQLIILIRKLFFSFSWVWVDFLPAI